MQLAVPVPSRYQETPAMPSNTEHAEWLLSPSPPEVVATKGASRALQPRLWRVEKGVLFYA
jgi:hypothetical protein